MQHSENIAAISSALAKAQGAIEGAKKDSANPHFKSKYADLASCWDACREALSANEIAVIQAPGELADGVVEITTMLCHSSGEWFREMLPFPLPKVDAHGLGSAITYGRRYALAAMVGIAPEDDDGNAAVQSNGSANDRPRQREREQPAPAEVPPQGWEAWADGFMTVVGSCESDDAITRLQNNSKGELRALSAADPKLYADIGGVIKAKRAVLAKPARQEPQAAAA